MESPEEMLSGTDEAALKRIRAVSTLMDDVVSVPGTNVSVGLDPLLSLDPSPVGDVVGGAISLYIVAEAANLGVPYTTIVRMLGNVTVDVVVGSVPVIGALFDTLWKANEKNVALVEEYVEGRSDLGTDDGDDDAEFVSIDVQDDD
jgi:hypothetical protein